MKGDNYILFATVIAEPHPVLSLAGYRGNLKVWGWIAYF
jgi:hypothetical protein